MAAKAKARKPSPIKVLVPHVEVQLLSGDYVTVKPWGFLQTELFMVRLQRLASIAEEHPNADSAALAAVFTPEIGSIIQDTIGYDDEQMAGLTMEDGLELARVIVEVSLLRPDGGGILGKMLKLRAYSRLFSASTTQAAPDEPKEDGSATP